jgi:hypothetical protein
LTVSDGLKRTRSFQKVAFLCLGIFLTSGLLLPLQPAVILAESITHTADPSQPEGFAEVAKNLVRIEPISRDDLLTVNLIFDGRLPLHNSFILSDPPRFVIELLDVGSALEESDLILDDDRVKQIQTQRHPGKFRVVLDLTSLDGISYLLKEENNRLAASFKIYAEQPPAQSAQLTDPAPISFGHDELKEGPSGGTVEEKTVLALEEEDKGIETESDDKQDALELQIEKDNLFDDEAIPQSQLDTFFQEPSILNPKLNAFFQELSEGFSYELRVLANERVSDVSDSPINPQNVLEIPKYTFNLDLRPDFYLNYRKLRLMAKPRYIMTWTRIEDGFRDGESDWDNDLFVNEWLAGLQPISSLFVSYGRENLQWGPSYLTSPSNPFFRDNGTRNPKLEIRGQDFARMVWVPSSSWSFSAIANTGKGENDLIKGFEPAYALKMDYTGYRKYFSVIPSYREKDRARLGAFAGWTVTDGLLLYTEATASQGTDVLYPVKTGQFTPLGVPVIRLEQTKDNSNSLEAIALFGASYTFDLGPTLTLEYLYNGPGYVDSQIDSLLDFTSQLDRIIGIIPPDLINRFFDLSDFTDLGLALFRRHYLNFQYQHPQIWDDLSIGLRYTFNVDDQSSQLIPLVQYDLNDHLQLFLVGTQNFGSKRDEFRFFVENSYFFGLQYTF